MIDDGRRSGAGRVGRLYRRSHLTGNGSEDKAQRWAEAPRNWCHGLLVNKGNIMSPHRPHMYIKRPLFIQHKFARYNQREKHTRGIRGNHTKGIMTASNGTR